MEVFVAPMMLNWKSKDFFWPEKCQMSETSEGEMEYYQARWEITVRSLQIKIKEVRDLRLDTVWQHKLSWKPVDES